MTKSLLLALAIALIPAAASAQTFELTVKNGFIEAMTSFSVSGAKVAGFKQIPASGKRSVSVTLPDGKCEANVSMNFADGQSLDGGAFDFCQYDVYAVEF